MIIITDRVTVQHHKQPTSLALRLAGRLVMLLQTFPHSSKPSAHLQRTKSPSESSTAYENDDNLNWRYKI